MPATTNDSNTILVKDGSASAVDSSVAGFWTAIDKVHTPYGWESVSKTTLADTTEQTIVDISGQAGVLTHVLGPGLSATGILTIRVTADGTLTTFISETLGAANRRFCIGHFPGWLATGSTSTHTGIGSRNDAGYSIVSQGAMITTALQALKEALVGITFKTSLKVTVQGSVNLAAGDNGKAAAIHSLFLPKGL